MLLYICWHASSLRSVKGRGSLIAISNDIHHYIYLHIRANVRLAYANSYTQVNVRVYMCKDQFEKQSDRVIANCQLHWLIFYANCELLWNIHMWFFTLVENKENSAYVRTLILFEMKESWEIQFVFLWDQLFAVEFAHNKPIYSNFLPEFGWKAKNNSNKNSRNAIKNCYVQFKDHEAMKKTPTKSLIECNCKSANKLNKILKEVVIGSRLTKSTSIFFCIHLWVRRCPF